MEGKKLTEETAKRLKALREQKGISHKTLSEALKEHYNIRASKGTLIAYEVADENHSQSNSFRGMSIERLFYLSQFYNVSADYILGLTDDNSKKTIAVDDLGLSSEACAVLRDLKQEGTDGSIQRLALKALSKVITLSSLIYVGVQYQQYLIAQEDYKNRDNLFTGDITESLYNVGVMSEGHFPPTNDPKKDFDSILLGRVESARHNIVIAFESALTCEEGE